MENDAVKEAQAALWDYINSLPPKEKQIALEYQKSLEAEAKITAGGMPVVLQKRCKHNMMLLQETLDEAHEAFAAAETTRILRAYC